MKPEIKTFLEEFKGAMGPVIADMIEERMSKALEERIGNAHGDPADGSGEAKGAADEAARSRQDKAAESDPGIATARLIRALAFGRGDPAKALRLADKWADARLRKDLEEAEAKELDATTIAGGGALIPEQRSEDFIERLRPRAIVRQMGALQVPMSRGVMSIPGQTESASASYVGSNDDIPPSSPEFGDRRMVLHKLAAIVAIPNDLLRDASPRVDTLVLRDMTREMRLREDLAFLRGRGTEYAPKGILHQVAPGHRILRTDDAGDVTLHTVTRDLLRLLELMETADAPMEAVGFVMHTRTKYYLRGLLNAHGLPVFAEEINAGTLFGFPFATTNQIPTDLDASESATGDESEVYAVDFSECLIGENLNLEAEVFPGGAYVDGDGNVISGVSRDRTIVRVISRHDFMLRQPSAAAVLEGVDWGSVA